jgi:type II secretory pathway component GspD/PulD (secretin)
MLHLSPSITALEEFLTYGTGGDPSADNNNNSDDDTRATYQLPRVSESSLNTRVLVNSGETVVLGGLVEDNEREEERKVPLLGDIPFVRHAFRYKERVSEPRHLLIFVTARVVDPDGRFVKVDDSLKNEENKNK